MIQFKLAFVLNAHAHTQTHTDVVTMKCVIETVMAPINITTLTHTIYYCLLDKMTNTQPHYIIVHEHKQHNTNSTHTRTLQIVTRTITVFVYQQPRIFTQSITTFFVYTLTNPS